MLGNCIEIVSPTFYAFVLDFYATLGDTPQEQEIENILVKIFSNRVVYGEFLKYCQENNYSFIDGEANKHVNATIWILTFEHARDSIQQGVKKSVIDILSREGSLEKLDFARECIPGIDMTYFDGMLRSVYNYNIVNNRGEVLYYIGEQGGFQLVYSRERGLHHVDKHGHIIDLIAVNQSDRTEMLKEINENFADVLLLLQTDYTPEQFKRLEELRAEYRDDRAVAPQGAEIEASHFRAWVWVRYQESLHRWKDVKGADPRKPALGIVL